MTRKPKHLDEDIFRNALERVLAYLWKAEQRDYLACPPTQRTSHIFKDLRAVATWLGYPRRDFFEGCDD